MGNITPQSTTNNYEAIKCLGHVVRAMNGVGEGRQLEIEAALEAFNEMEFDLEEVSAPSLFAEARTTLNAAVIGEATIADVLASLADLFAEVAMYDVNETNPVSEAIRVITNYVWATARPQK